jgi:hypothetical protein
LVATGFFLEAGLDVLDEDWADIVTTELGGYLWETRAGSAHIII